MQRENAFDAFIIDDSTHREHLIDASPATHDDGAAKDLNALLVPFDDAGMHIDGVADQELRDVLFQAGGFDLFKKFVTHGRLRGQKLEVRVQEIQISNSES